MSGEKKSWNFGMYKELVFQGVADLLLCLLLLLDDYAFFVPHHLANSSNHNKMTTATYMNIVFTPTCSPTKIPR